MAMMLVPAASFDGEAILPIERAIAFLRIDDPDEGVMIEALRDAAIDWVERHTSIGLSSREWTWTGGAFGSPMRLPFGPVTAVSSISWRDHAGTSTTLADDAWRVGAGIVMAASAGGWPCTGRWADAVSITFQAGYADVAREAPALLAAVKMLLGHLFENREAVVTGTIATEVPFGVIAMCAPYRVPVIG